MGMARRARVSCRRARFGALVVCPVLVALLALAPPALAAAPSVVLLSLDGVRFDQIDAAGLPAFGRMQREGARAERLQVVFPSLTFPNHVALATGAPVDRHGIVMNAFEEAGGRRFFYDNDASWIEAEPVWAAAERQGVKAATFFWVGSETPWRGVAASHRRAPFDESVSETEKVRQILAWLDLPEAERPRLVLSWWHGTDSLAHRLGPGAPRVAERLREQDAALGELLAGLDARGRLADTTLIVVSDHGMSEASQAIDPATALRRAGIDARVQPAGGMAQVWLADPAQRTRAIETLRALPGLQVHARDALPAAWRYAHPTRTGDLVLLASPPHVIVEPGAAPGLVARIVRALSVARGAHGFDPGLREMGGILLAIGRGVPAGARLGEVHVLDVAASVCALLGIDPPAASEGRPIAGLGAAASSAAPSVAAPAAASAR